ncbi:unnamed protein product [Microthlaspi erraticum]|uniref:Uncharacterized protein n=1 Tax=Microthlaspi erraticum TaxID=1685480 RepID=A0A6D2LCY1_9BRAS|nr:unnamed protein product [Microthlaspi erraticum]
MPESSSSFSSSLTLLLIIFLFLLLCTSISSAEYEVRVLDRALLEIRKNPTKKKPKCCEMRTRSQCSDYPRCRWCRSEALDDLCFGKSEALRLPSQVFLCEL